MEKGKEMAETQGNLICGRGEGGLGKGNPGMKGFHWT